MGLDRSAPAGKSWSAWAGVAGYLTSLSVAKNADGRLEAFGLAAALPGDVMVAGGGEIYTLALPYATHQVLTEVDASPPGDAFYPHYPVDEWAVVRRESGEGCEWLWLERMDPAA